MESFWRNHISLAAYYFENKEPDKAMKIIREISTNIADLPPEEQMCAIGTAAILVEEKGNVIEAIKLYESLVDLAAKYDTSDIRTARDLVRLGDLYEKINEFEKKKHVLDKAYKIYKWLSLSDQQQLQSTEFGSVIHDQTQLNLSIESQKNLKADFRTKKSVLLGMANALRNEITTLRQYPDKILQQIHNGLLPHSSFANVHDLIDNWKNYLNNTKQSWCELVRIGGPGKDSWLLRQYAINTYFPQEIEQFVALPGKRFIVFDKSGNVWLATRGGMPAPMTLPCVPRKGKFAVANIGNHLSLIDKEEILHFIQVRKNSVSELSPKYKDAQELTTNMGCFITTFKDGSNISFKVEGDQEVKVSRADTEKNANDKKFTNLRHQIISLSPLTIANNFSLQTVIPVSLSSMYIGKKIFEDDDENNIFLHIASDQTITTWEMSKLIWYQTFSPNWVEKAFFIKKKMI